ncbi:MAG TPA: DUF2946 domain-containing protein [Methylophilaceae bacterium]
MNFFRRQRTVIAISASFAILLASLMPTITQAFASRQVTDSFLSAICSNSGVAKFVSFAVVPVKSDQPAQNKPMAMEHCPYCFTHAGSFGIMPGHELTIVKLALSQPYPQLFYRSPYPLFAWISANPRAPPVFS